MPRSPALSLTLATVLGLAACGGGNTHEALAKESVAVMEDFGDSLAKITDKASAEKHVSELERLVSRMNDIQARMEKLGEPSEATSTEMEKMMKDSMGPAMQKMTQHMMRIGNDPEIMSVVGPVIEKIDK